jgi:ppGpp synthetase/RelA/SpoT-type nucleotidyltranferase
MKVSLSTREMFENQVGLNNRLKDVVDKRITLLKHPRWHYESRVKSLESFALKVETGRFKNPTRLEDFFACTLVVTNASEIDAANELICKTFALDNRRPERATWTHKSPDSFPFDDLRLYVTLGKDSTLPESDLDNILFEVQIKTFLQHAWSIATHDLIYKSDAANWGKERIAYQIKAMLEHAELSIQEVERLADNPSLAKENKQTEEIRKIIELLKRHWSGDELPQDIRRLAQNINQLLDVLGVKINRLDRILDSEKEKTDGYLPLNLSPYGVIVQSLFRYEKSKMVLLLTSEKEKVSVVIHPEIELPEDIDQKTCRNAIFITRPIP